MNNRAVLRLIPIAKKNRDRLAGNPTKAEVKMRAILIQLGIAYEFQYIIWSKYSFFIADFLIPNKEGKKYILELDGGYHFSHQQKKSDKNRSSKIRFSGKNSLTKNYGVLRLKNDDVLHNTEKVIKKLKRFKII